MLASFTNCEGAEINLVPGVYNYEYTLVASGALAQMIQFNGNNILCLHLPTAPFVG